MQYDLVYLNPPPKKNVTLKEPQRFGETDPSQLPEFQGHLEQHHPQEGSSVLGEQAVGGQPEEMEVVEDDVLVVHTGKYQLKVLNRTYIHSLFNQ